MLLTYAIDIQIEIMKDLVFKRPQLQHFFTLNKFYDGSFFIPKIDDTYGSYQTIFVCSIVIESSILTGLNVI